MHILTHSFPLSTSRVSFCNLHWHSKIRLDLKPQFRAMKLFLVMSVVNMEALVQASAEWHLPCAHAIFAVSLRSAWELAMRTAGRMLKVTPSTVSEPPKKKQRVASDVGSGESPSKLPLLSLLGEPMAALQIERNVSELLAEWTQHHLGYVLHEMGYAPPGNFLWLHPDDRICALHETIVSMCPWSPLVALNTPADLAAAKMGRWPAAAALAIPAPVSDAAATTSTPAATVAEEPAAGPDAAAGQRLEQEEQTSSPSSPASSNATTLVFGGAAPECHTFYVPTTQFFITELMASTSPTGVVSGITLHPDNFKTLKPLVPGRQVVPLFKDVKTATYAVHLHASVLGCGSKTRNVVRKDTQCLQWNMLPEGCCFCCAVLNCVSSCLYDFA
jgi:hypothetical protein